MVNFLDEARKIESEIIETRREIHAKPELAYQEKATSKLGAEQLKALGLEVRTGVGGKGVMENPKVDFVFGLHIDGDENSGVLAFRGGPVMAAPDTFEIKIIGRGGHGAYPHQTVDPIYVAAQLIIAIQGISGRMIDPVQPFVITVGSIHSGTKENIIPDQAVLQGTIRTLDEATRKRAKAKVAEVARGVSRAFGARAEVEFEKDAYPVTVNDEKVTEEAKKILSKMPGTRVKIKALQLGGEDFSRFLHEAPGTFN